MFIIVVVAENYHRRRIDDCTRGDGSCREYAAPWVKVVLTDV
jgi:hypothetical protein